MVIMVLLWLQLLLLTAPSPTASQALPNCPEKCGDVSIPYPFGIGPACSRQSFSLTCDSTFNPPKLFIVASYLEVTSLSLLQGQARVKLYSTIAMDCNNQTGKVSNQDGAVLIYDELPYTFSKTHNVFTAIGCDTVAYIFGNDSTDFTSGCVSVCSQPKSVVSGKCLGKGCCQTSIPEGLKYYGTKVRTLSDQNQALNFSPCSYAFLVDQDLFEFHGIDDLSSRSPYSIGNTIPVVMEWAVGGETCVEAVNNSTSYACRDMNSYCYNSPNAPGYRCNCSYGYEGNPYLSNGCQDIDECSSNPCIRECHNTDGSFYCSCGWGMRGDGKKDGTGCIRVFPALGVLFIGIGSGVGLLMLLASGTLCYRRLKKRNVKMLKENFFRQNRGLLLQQLISSSADVAEKTKIFSLEELEKATNNFDDTRILGRGGHGTVYKGILLDQRVVAIKKSKITVQSETDQFINEVVILSQINHRNVVKLFGCCLETQVPLLVYEFISKGNLFDHLHDWDCTSLSWKDRLRIATETARALSYIHSAASISVFHRDVKSSNVLLDDNYTAKLSDFGASRTVALDQNCITTRVQGTFGYMDPEYFHTSQLTEKSDVYSFGVILVELLTGKKPIFRNRFHGEEINLTSHFISSLRENGVPQVLEARVREEGKKEELEAVARLAEMCLKLRGEERPTMKEVEMKLEALRTSNNEQQHQWVASNREEIESIQMLSLTSSNDNHLTRQYSLEKQFMSSVNFPR